VTGRMVDGVSDAAPVKFVLVMGLEVSLPEWNVPWCYFCALFGAFTVGNSSAIEVARGPSRS
jgi:hypothetical protein